jgi:type IV secretory pathway protease TraF
VQPPRILLWNASASVPVGLYALETTDKRYVSELVAVLPPEPLATFLAAGNYLPRGVPMLKHVLALPGQTVCRDGLVVTVDKVATGVARERDRTRATAAGLAGLPRHRPGELFLMNWQSADSLDGRYFGPIPASAVFGRAHPFGSRRRIDHAALSPQAAALLFARRRDPSSFPAGIQQEPLIGRSMAVILLMSVAAGSRQNGMCRTCRYRAAKGAHLRRSLCKLRPRSCAAIWRAGILDQQR